MQNRQEMIKYENDSDSHLAMAMDKVIKLNNKVESLLSPKLTFRLPSFNQHKTSNSLFYSPSFYMHKGGYKMCIGVHANGCDEEQGSYILVFTYLMKGDYDDNLEWPIQGKVT